MRVEPGSYGLRNKVPAKTERKGKKMWKKKEDKLSIGFFFSLEFCENLSPRRIK